MQTESALILQSSPFLVAAALRPAALDADERWAIFGGEGGASHVCTDSDGIVRILRARQHHIPQTPDQHPKVGTSDMLRGNHNQGKSGWSRRVHYEITGAGRIDYEYHPRYKTSSDGDEHAVVRILVINLSSH